MRKRHFPRVHVLHIGKTGGTALKHAIRQADPEGRIHLHPHGTRLRDIPSGEGVVFFLRDPVARFVSGFLSRQRQGRPRYQSPWTEAEAKAFGAYSTADALATALSADDEESRAPAARAMKSIRHVRDSFWYWLGDADALRRRAGDLLLIGQQEHLAEDVAVLEGLLEVGPLRLPGDEVDSHRNPANLDRSLSPQALVNLRRWYAADYEALILCRQIARAAGVAGSLAADI